MVSGNGVKMVGPGSPVITGDGFRITMADGGIHQSGDGFGLPDIPGLPAGLTGTGVMGMSGGIRYLQDIIGVGTTDGL